jgi:hypothetical protein
MEKTYSEEKLAVHSRIDCTCVLDKGVICNHYPDGQIDASPASDSKVLSILRLVRYCYFMV